MGKDPGKKFAQLRRRAEALLGDRREDPREKSAKSLPDLIHELEVEQIELEMQNEELRQAEQRLEASQKKYADLYNFAPVGYFTFDQKGTILEANLTGAGLLGVERERLIGTPFPSWCEPTSADQFYLHERRVLKAQKSETCELKLKKSDGALFDAQLESIATQDKDGQLTLCQSALWDITERKQVEKAMRQSEERFHTLFSSMNEGFALCEILLDAENKPCDWRYLELNPAFERQTGIPVAQAIGRTVREILPDIEPVWIETYGKVALTGEPAHIENFVQNLGRYFEVFAYCPTAGRFAAVFLDVTERKKTEETQLFLIRCGSTVGENFFNSLARYLAEILAMDYVCIDRLQGDTLTAQTLSIYHDGNFEDNVAYALKDTPCGDVVGKSICCFPRDVRHLFPSDAVLQEMMAESYVGTTLWSSKGQPIGLIAVIGRQPLTNPQLAESILKLVAVRAAGELERMQAEEELRRANAQLAEADRRKDEFMSMLAHELRNPLAPIRNAVELLNLTGPESPALQRSRDMINRQVSHMSRLLDDLLNVSRITQGKIKLQLKTLDLREVVDRAIETSHAFFEERGHSLYYTRPPEPIWLEGDPVRLEQVLCNLLNNAGKYSETGGTIWIKIEQERPKDDQASPMALVRMRDAGIGIAPELLPRVFDLFAQADHSLERVRGGLGIGLTLVRNLVEMHGGRVEAFSEGLGRGSEFVVYLPVMADSLVQAAIEESPRLPDQNRELKAELITRKIKILVVDDLMDTAQSMVELLELWGHEALAAYDGLKAVELARIFQPEVVLLDIGLPGMSGHEVARKLRSEVGLSSALLIALTGYGQDEDRQRAEDAGFDLHLTKPVDLLILQDILQKASEGMSANELTDYFLK